MMSSSMSYQLNRPPDGDISWWKKRLISERSLALIACSASVICIALAIGLGIVALKPVQNICSTQSCIHIASDVLNYVNQSMDPCDNFYQYACGRFLESTIIPHDKDALSQVEILENLFYEQIDSIVNDPTNSTITDQNNARKFQKSCMSMNRVNEKGGYGLLDILKYLGGWPVVDGDLWNETQFNWKESVYKLRDIGYPHDYYFIGLEFRRNNTNLTLNLNSPKLMTSPDDFLKIIGNNITTCPYYMNMVNVSILLGAERKRAEEELLESLKFEIKLANISSSREELVNSTPSNPFTIHPNSMPFNEFMETFYEYFYPSVSKERVNDTSEIYDLMTISNLAELYPSIPWKDYVNRLLPSGINVDDNQTISVRRSYIGNFEKLINETSKRVQANYLMWRAIDTSLLLLNLVTSVNGPYYRLPSWKGCLWLTSEIFPEFISYMYFRKYFDKDTKQIVSLIATNIKNQFLTTLQTANWLDEQSRKGGTGKYANLSVIVAYPEDILHDKANNELLKDLKLNDNNLLQNLFSIRKIMVEHVLTDSTELFDKSNWTTFQLALTPDIVKYADRGNTIFIPAAILQGILFNVNGPQYMNYGAIGSLIGYTIMKLFDPTDYHDYEIEHHSAWYTPTTKDKFHERAQCMIDQYNNYTVEKVEVARDEFSTLYDNIVHNDGVKIVYSAYNHWLAGNGPESQLPGLPYTNRQMFWISAVRIFCSKEKSMGFEKKIKADPDRQKEFRIIGMLSNIPEFSEDFNCPIGSTMNPKNKCTVW